MNISQLHFHHTLFAMITIAQFINKIFPIDLIQITVNIFYTKYKSINTFDQTLFAMKMKNNKFSPLFGQIRRN